MKKQLAVMVMALVMMGCAGSVTMVRDKSFTLEKYKKIAVMDFAGNDKEAGAALSESLVPLLMDAGFEVIERSQLAAILKEKELDMSGTVDAEALQRIGRVAGVNAVVLGNFHMIHRKNQQEPARRGGLIRRIINKGRAWNDPIPIEEIIFQTITVRIVDAATGKVLLSSKSDHEIREADLDKFYESFSASIKNSFK